MKIIDFHCDTITRCHDNEWELTCEELHFSLNKLGSKDNILQAFAIFMPDDLRGKAAVDYFESVYRYFAEHTVKNGIKVLRDFRDAKRALNNKLTVFLTVEGGSVLAGEINACERLAALGVKILTLTWNAENELGGGAATALGLTQFGRDAVRALERNGIIIDVSHLSDNGFYDLAEIAARPFMATHSNSRTICGHRRNLTDDMFKYLVKKGGVTGLNFSDYFIKDGGGSVDIADLIRHIEHFISLGGEDNIVLGSDYDGTDIPQYLDDAGKLENLYNEIESRYSCTVADKIFYTNALDFFKRYENRG